MSSGSSYSDSTTSLMSLAPETRVTIYEYCLEDSQARYLQHRIPSWTPTKCPYTLKSTSHRNLLFVCRQLYSELHQSYYSKTALYVKCDWWNPIDPRPYINAHFQQNTRSLVVSADGALDMQFIGLFQNLRSLRIPDICDGFRIRASTMSTFGDDLIWDRLRRKPELLQTLDNLRPYAWLAVTGRYDLMVYGSAIPYGSVSDIL